MSITKGLIVAVVAVAAGLSLLLLTMQSTVKAGGNQIAEALAYCLMAFGFIAGYFAIRDDANQKGGG